MLLVLVSVLVLSMPLRTYQLYCLNCNPDSAGNCVWPQNSVESVLCNNESDVSNSYQIDANTETMFTCIAFYLHARPRDFVKTGVHRGCFRKKVQSEQCTSSCAIYDSYEVKHNITLCRDCYHDNCNDFYVGGPANGNRNLRFAYRPISIVFLLFILQKCL